MDSGVSQTTGNVQSCQDERATARDRLIKQIERARAGVERSSRKLRQLLDSCPHDATPIKEEEYYSGGYNYRARTVYKSRCPICNAVTSTKRKNTIGMGDA